MTSKTADAAQIIELRCAEMRFPATAEEKERLTNRYLARRAEVESLYAMSEVKYEEPGVFFRPMP
ncbi:MAG: hypothetical protein ACK5MR_05585 [Cumulibacter sp.]